MVFLIATLDVYRLEAYASGPTTYTYSQTDRASSDAYVIAFSARYNVAESTPAVLCCRVLLAAKIEYRDRN